MIEVSARLTQGVFLAGETVEVAVTVKNPSPPRDAKSQWNDLEEVLAWASAQIHCQAWMSAAKVVVPPHHTFAGVKEESAVSNSRTSFAPCSGPSMSSQSMGSGGGASGNSSGRETTGEDKRANINVTSRVVVSTKPVILLCDLRLLPGESKTFWYRETLPVEGPPSFRGQAVKYAYKLTIGTQRVNAPIRLLRVPLRALVLQEFTDSALAAAALVNGSEDATLHPSNPFLSENDSGGDGNNEGSSYNCPSSYLDSALQVLQIVTSSRHQKFYNVTNARGHVVKFCIFKQAYKLGEDIVGSLDFSGANVPCLQYAVTLQSVEEVSAECRKIESQKPSISSFSKTHEMCVGYGQTHFVLPVPLQVTPSFYTEIVSLKWRLHFEFVTSTEEGSEGGMMKPKEKPKKDDMNGAVWSGPTDIHIETMVWDLPIKLYPNLPSYISQGLQMQTLYDMKISNGPTGFS